MKEDKAISVLRKVKETLDEHNVEYWLDCGTLLGVERDGKLIAWDHDIDLFTWPSQFSNRIKRQLAKELSDKDVQVNILKDTINIQNKRSKVIVDIHSYRLYGNKVIWPRFRPVNLLGRVLQSLTFALWAPYFHNVEFGKKPYLKNFIKSSTVKISRSLPYFLRIVFAEIARTCHENIGSKDFSLVIPAEYFRNLTTKNFYGMEFKVPIAREEYLAFRFGEDWRVPKEDWVTTRDDGAVVKNGWRNRKTLWGN